MRSISPFVASAQMRRGVWGYHEHAPGWARFGEQPGEDRGGGWPPGYAHPGRQFPAVWQSQVPGVEGTGDKADAGTTQQRDRAGEKL